VRGERARARLLRPFPVVRIRGWLTERGAMVRLLTVRTPRGVRVAVRCRGDGCPRGAWAREAGRARLTRLRPFEGFLRAGVELRIRVTRPGWIGKHTTIQIRRGRPPARTDRCLYPGRSKPARCVRP
jgi:hypothetical protein